MPRKKELSFEEALNGLESIVQDMENSEVSLSELMENYAKGIDLAKKCTKALERAEKTMDLLVDEEKQEIQELKLTIEGE